jgi:Mn2+/Fe2+ NRAMP family transporter
MTQQLGDRLVPPKLEGEGGRIEYAELPPELSGGWLRLVRVFGPGAVIASVTVGTGETIFSPRLGAIFAYDVLWIIALAVIFKGVLVYTGARHLVLTGEHPMQAWAGLPGPRAWLPTLIGGVAVISFPLWVGALSDAVASLCVWITGWGQNVPWGRPAWSTAIIVTAMTLSVIQTYNVVERVSTAFLALKIFFIVVAIFVIRPDWSAALAGFVTPALPAYEPWVAERYPDIAAQSALLQLAVFLGVIGGGVQDYVGYVGMVREKAWGNSATSGPIGPKALPHDPASVRRGLAWLRAPLFDVVSSFICVLVMTSCFMILGAAVLHPQMQVPTDADLYSKQSQFLGLVHPSLVIVYKAGIFFAMFGAIYGTFEVFGRTAYEPLRAIWPSRPWSYTRVRLLITLYSGLGALVVLWTGFKAVMIVRVTSPVSGVIGCGLWCLAMLWVDRRMPRAYRMHPVLAALTLVTGLTMAIVGAYTTYKNWVP